VRNIINFTVIIISAVIFYFIFHDRIVELYSHYFPCRRLIYYSIRSFDERFGINRTDLEKALESASAIWEVSIGKDLFAYDSGGNLDVNLVYDERQEASLESEKASMEIDKDKSAYDSAREEYEILKAKYATLSREYDELLFSFEKKSRDYSSRVSYWNKHGGALENEYNRLEVEKSELLNFKKIVEERRTEINFLVEELDRQIAKLNILAKEVNESVREYNSGDFVGKEFEEGIYIRDNDGTRINIYEFTSREELVRVLAHELGHALGLDHNENPESIMYELNQSSNDMLTVEDKRDLISLCSR
jgi:hypothetical protein